MEIKICRDEIILNGTYSIEINNNLFKSLGRIIDHTVKVENIYADGKHLVVVNGLILLVNPLDDLAKSLETLCEELNEEIEIEKVGEFRIWHG